MKAAECLARGSTSRECSFTRVFPATRESCNVSPENNARASRRSVVRRFTSEEKVPTPPVEKEAPLLEPHSDVPDAGRRSDPRRAVGALSCFPPKIAITKRVRALCVRAARSV